MDLLKVIRKSQQHDNLLKCLMGTNQRKFVKYLSQKCVQDNPTDSVNTSDCHEYQTEPDPNIQLVDPARCEPRHDIDFTFVDQVLAN